MGTSIENNVEEDQSESVFKQDVSLIVRTYSSGVKLTKSKSDWEKSMKAAIVDVLRIPNERELLKIVYRLQRVLTKEASKESISLKRITHISRSVTDILRSLKLVPLAESRNADDTLKLKMVGTVLVHLLKFLSKHTVDTKIVEEASQIQRFLKNILDSRMGWVLTVLLAVCDPNNIGATELFVYQLLRLTVQDIHKQQLEKGINQKLAAAENIIRLNANKFKEKYRAELISSWKEGKNNGLLSSKNVAERIQECQQRLACLDKFKRLKQEISSLSESSTDKPVEWELSSKPDMLLKTEESDNENEEEQNSEVDGDGEGDASAEEESLDGTTESNDVAQSASDQDGDDAEIVSDHDGDDAEIDSDHADDGAQSASDRADDDAQSTSEHADDVNDEPQEIYDYESSDEEIDFSEDESGNEESFDRKKSDDSDSDSDSDNERMSKRLKLA